MEEFYEWLAWFYGTMRNTVVKDAYGYSYQLSQLIQLSRGEIPYSERFTQMSAFDKDAIIQNLAEFDICCSREDWVNLGRLPSDLYDQQDSSGQSPFISMEGVPLLFNSQATKQALRQLKNFLSYLLAVCNWMRIF